MGEVGPSASALIKYGGGSANGVHFIKCDTLEFGLSLVEDHILPAMRIVTDAVAAGTGFSNPNAKTSVKVFQNALEREFKRWASQHSPDRIIITVCLDKSCLKFEASTSIRYGQSNFFWILAWRTGEGEISSYGFRTLSQGPGSSKPTTGDSLSLVPCELEILCTGSASGPNHSSDTQAIVGALTGFIKKHQTKFTSKLSLTPMVVPGENNDYLITIRANTTKPDAAEMRSELVQLLSQAGLKV